MHPPSGSLRNALLLVAWLTAILLAEQSRAQCGAQWLPGDGVPGADQRVDAVAGWDPDGAGPLPTRVVIGGSFKVAGGTLVTGVAMWSGTAWQPIGPALPVVRALAVINGELFAGGTFSAVGGSNIARWTGTAWQAVGGGILSGSVHAIAVHNGQLVAGGQFTRAGGPANVVSNIAVWNGTVWSSPGSGLDGTVFALTSYNGALIAGGNFANAGGQPASMIAQWNGSGWQPLGDGISGTSVNSLLAFGPDLIVGGTFGLAGQVIAQNVARWDGAAWQAMAMGSESTVAALTVYRGEIVAGGSTYASGGAVRHAPIRWTGSQWSIIGTGVGPGHTAAAALAIIGDELLVSGTFRTAGDRGAVGIAAWNETTQAWRTFGTGSNAFTIDALASFRGELIAGGDFTVMGQDVPARGIARWDGTAWRSLGGISCDHVYALQVYQGDLIVGGATFTGDVNTIGAARWDGTAWHAMALGLPGVVNVLAEYNGELIAGGAFTIASGGPSDYLARWSGTSWTPLGGTVAGLPFRTSVTAITVHGQDLIIGGQFTSVAGVPAVNVARWDGSTWSAMSGGLPSPSSTLSGVYALQSFGPDLVAGGNFTTASGSVANYIARWTGSQWTPLGPSPSAQVAELLVFNSELIAGGSFLLVGTVQASTIARWNGSVWQPLGSGLNQVPFALAEHNGALVVGGYFSTAGGLVSGKWARWVTGGTPSIALSPAPQSVRTGATLTMTAAPSNGFSGVSYRWTRNGLPVLDGPAGASTGGGSVSGSSGLLASPTAAAIVTLHIVGAQPSDSGNYAIEFTNSCGTGTSAQAIASVTTCVPADFNGSGMVTVQDIFDFLVAYFMLDPRADVNGVGGITVQDIFDFLVGYFAGCT